MKLRPIYDPAYIEARDKLIPKAEAWANHRAKLGERFDPCFCDRMQQLAEEAGLTMTPKVKP